jgi:hypothetical protein
MPKKISIVEGFQPRSAPKVDVNFEGEPIASKEASKRHKLARAVSIDGPNPEHAGIAGALK